MCSSFVRIHIKHHFSFASPLLYRAGNMIYLKKHQRSEGDGSMLSLPPMKRGDTFSVFADIVGSSAIDITKIKAQVRNASGDLFSDLVVTSTTTADRYLLKAPVTDAWEPGILYMDIQYTDSSGTIISSETISIPVRKDVTYG